MVKLNLNKHRVGEVKIAAEGRIAWAGKMVIPKLIHINCEADNSEYYAKTAGACAAPVLLTQCFESVNTLKVGRDAAELVRGDVVPDDLIKGMQRGGAARAVQRLVAPR